MPGFLSRLSTKFLSGLFSPRPPLPAAAGQNGDMKPTAPGRPQKRRRENEFTSYHGRPVVKRPHWVWPVWVYFWTGGLAGGAGAIATAAHFFGDPTRDRAIVRAGRYISLAGLLISPAMLIIDLQRPERFHHMLRVLKLRSPLSVGTYVLTTAGLLSGLTAARQAVEDGLVPPHSLAGRTTRLVSNDLTQALQGLDSLALGSYTGVLLSATAIPLWAELDTVLAPLFLASAFSTGAASITLARALAGTAPGELHRLRAIESGALLSELALTAYGAVKLKPAVRQAAFAGRNGALLALAISLGQLAPLLFNHFSPAKGGAVRAVSGLSSLLALAGGFLLRVAVVEAGRASAGSAEAYHATTRGQGRAGPQEQAARYKEKEKDGLY